ncbi:MAG: family 43 glycosylhydrolase [Thermoguttaceae bacterium]
MIAMTRQLFCFGLAMFVFICAAFADDKPATAPAPGLPAPKQGLRLPDMPVHDPWILAHEESKTYYLYSAARQNVDGVSRSGTLTYKSKNLLDWDGPYIVFSIPDGIWANPSQGAWAPEVHRYNGKYYLFVTLHNSERVIDRPPDVWRVTHMRGTVIAAADSPEGPFKVLKPDGPHPPADFMTLDGTLYVEDGVPWMVYAHEWIQMIDGMIEAGPFRRRWRSHPSVQGLRRPVAQRPAKARQKRKSLRHRRAGTVSHKDRPTAHALVELRPRRLRADRRPLRVRQTRRTVETTRSAGGQRQRPRDALPDIRGPVDDGATSTLPPRPGETLRHGRHRRQSKSNPPTRRPARKAGIASRKE